MDGSFTPTRVLLLVGGVGMAVAAFLSWAPNAQTFDVDGNLLESRRVTGWDLGMLGLWQVIIGVLIALIAVAGMTGVRLPDQVFGFDFLQALVVLAAPVLLWNFGLQFDDVFGGIGLFIGWVAAAIAIGGAEVERRNFQSTAAAPAN